MQVDQGDEILKRRDAGGLFGGWKEAPRLGWKVEVEVTEAGGRD